MNNKINKISERKVINLIKKKGIRRVNDLALELKITRQTATKYIEAHPIVMEEFNAMKEKFISKSWSIVWAALNDEDDKYRQDKAAAMILKFQDSEFNLTNLIDSTSSDNKIEIIVTNFKDRESIEKNTININHEEEEEEE